MKKLEDIDLGIISWDEYYQLFIDMYMKSSAFGCDDGCDDAEKYEENMSFICE